jgi:hypothetical protein
MNVNVPSSAPMGPPETGASTKDIDEPEEEVVEALVVTALATSRMVAVSMVPHSIMIFFSFVEDLAAASTPAITPVFGSKYTAFTAGEFGSMVITMF